MVTLLVVKKIYCSSSRSNGSGKADLNTNCSAHNLNTGNVTRYNSANSVSSTPALHRKNQLSATLPAQCF